MRKFLNLILLLFLAFPAAPVQASRPLDAPSPYDLIAEVNALRAAYGLGPLEVNSQLMSSSQIYADYLISSGSSGHYASGTPDTRAAAAGYPVKPGLDIQECWAAQYGSSASASKAVYEQWSDAEHMAVMLHPYAVHVGAGVSKGSDGRVVFILDVAVDFNGDLRKGTPLPTRDPNATVDPNSPPQATRVYINPVVTVTPQADGQVIHEVKAGEAVWSIATAYGVKVEDLIRLNNLSATPVVYPGQKLVVRVGATALPSASPTPTGPTPTLTPDPTATRRPQVTRTPQSSPTPTPAPNAGITRRTIGLGLIVLCTAGLAAVLASGFFSQKKRVEGTKPPD